MAPPKKRITKSERLQIRITTEMKGKLDRIAEKKELTVSALCAMWLKEKIEEEVIE